MQRLVTTLLLVAACRGEPEIEKLPAGAADWQTLEAKKDGEATKSDELDRVERDRAHAKVEKAQHTVERIAHESYLAWAKSNRDKPCPDEIAELLAFAPDKDPSDPWGRPYAMRCTANPSDFGVYSRGPDGEDGTADDVRSWDRSASLHAD